MIALYLKSTQQRWLSWSWKITSTTLSSWSWSHSGEEGHHAVQSQGVIIQNPAWSQIGYKDENHFDWNLCCTVRSLWPSVPRRKSSPPSWLEVRQRLRVTWLHEFGDSPVTFLIKFYVSIVTHLCIVKVSVQARRILNFLIILQLLLGSLGCFLYTTKLTW